MLTLRSGAIVLALGTLLQGAAAAEPDHVTYNMGGLMTVPLEITGDLVTGAFSRSAPPPGKLHFEPGTEPVVTHWIVPPERLAALRHLAAKVWRRGMEISEPIIRHRPHHILSIELFTCPRPSDVVTTLTLEQGGRKRDFYFSTNCLNKGGKAFLDGLLAGE